MRTRRVIATVILALAVAIAAYSVWWWQAAMAVERGVLAWIEEQRSAGTMVEHRGLTVTGYPLSIRAALESPHLATRGVEWQGTRLVAEAPPWNHTRIALDLPGEQRLTLVQANQPPFDLRAKGGGTGHVLLTFGGLPVELQIGLKDLVAQPDALPVPVAALDLTATQPAEPPAGHGDAGLSVSATASGVTLPQEVPGSLGRQVERALVTARVMGRPPKPEPASLSAWSREGGTVQLDSLKLDWGPLKLAMNGTLALDAALQPQAALTAEVRGFQAVLDALQGVFRPKELAFARTMLTMLARPAEPGGEPVLTAPVTVQNQALFLGPLKVAALPPVVW
ncbi:DUF2125 domain-containing protein [Azospirillum canadense]|uniref:DUF2125 domain-containing protein n=1 Tax=Azospirillum canadense TaxID=403962 RepID=UPI00222761D8|nr:DUF2125 domain-containing protein [Azospirillum canadense]MCW2242706.1 hypothetical protein [Azospirillum canadense]